MQSQTGMQSSRKNLSWISKVGPLRLTAVLIGFIGVVILQRPYHALAICAAKAFVPA